MSHPVSVYYDQKTVKQTVDAGGHRDAVGGMWDEMGAMQRDFLVQNGLMPTMTVLDIGCGCLRAGIPLIEYLKPNHYFGTDISQDLLDVGYDAELKAAGLQAKLSRSHLLCSDDFDFSGVPAPVDMAIAQSVFTHLTLNHIRVCLSRLAPYVRPGGVFFATFFECPAELEIYEPVEHEPAAIVTTHVSDPYHYRAEDFHYLCKNTVWTMQYIGEWNHPRGQRMLQFTRSA